MNTLITELIYREKIEILLLEDEQVMDEISFEVSREQAIKLVEDIIKAMHLDVVKAPLSDYMKIS